MRTLFITRVYSDWWLYPPIGGASLRNWQNINAMTKLGSVGVFCLVGDQHYNNSADRIERPPNLDLWKINVVKEYKFNIIEKLNQRLQQFISLFTRGHPFTDSSTYRSPNVIQDLKNVLEEFKPNIVVISEVFAGSYLVDIQKYQCKIIYDAHNVESSLLRQNLRLKQKSGFNQGLRNFINVLKIESIEKELVRHANQIWACSAKDISGLKKLTSKKLDAHVIPNGIDSNYYSNIRLSNHIFSSEFKSSISSIHTLIFPAVFGTEPNSQAAKFLLDNVYPKTKEQYPDCQILLVGRNPTQYMIEAADKDPSIIVTGGVEDMRPYFSAASIFVVPLFQGSGTRLKILEAFACCRPVVSTSKGAEGIDATSGEHLLIGDTAEELVSHICNLWSDSLLRERLVKNAFELFEQEYSWNAVEAKVKKAIDFL